MDEFIYLKVPAKLFSTSDIIKFANSKNCILKYRATDKDIFTLEPEASDPVKTMLKMLRSENNGL